VKRVEAPRILERATEQAALQGAMQRLASGSGGIALVRGEAGIGKTRLVKQAIASAAGLGLCALAATAGELELDLPYAVVRQLFQPLLRGQPTGPGSELFDGSARFAQDLLSSDSVSTLAISQESILLGFYWLMVALTEHTPVVLFVDDVQWCDHASLQVLSYLARRLEGLGLLLVLSERDDGRPLQSASLLAGIDHEAEVLEPAPLTIDAVRELLAAQAELDPTPEFATACRDTTGGNPFLLGELARELAVGRWEGSAAEADAVRDVGPRAVAEAVLVRLAKLPAGSVEVARSLAVLGDETELRLVASLAGVGLDDAAAALDGLVRHGIIDDARPVRFVHPIVRQSIYAELTAPERARRHRRAATLLRTEGAPDERVASHLVLAEPAGDPEIVALLHRVSQVAMLHWDTARACRYLERAVAEPPPLELRAAMVRDWRLAEVLALRDGAEDRLRAALAEPSDLDGKLLAARILAGRLAVADRVVESIEVLAAILEQVRAALAEATDPATCARLDRMAKMLISDLIDTAGVEPRALDAARGPLEAAGALEDLDPDTVPTTYEDRVALVTRGGVLIRRGEPVDRCRSYLRAARADGVLRFINPASPKFVPTALLSVVCEDFEMVDSIIDDATTEALRTGSSLGFVQARMVQTYVALRRGQVRDAEAAARAVAEAGGAPPAQLTRLWVAWWVKALAFCGRPDEAREVLAEHALDGPLPSGYATAFLRDARGWLAYLDGLPELAAEEFLGVGEQFLALGVQNPAVIPWRIGAAVALAATDPDQALGLASTSLDHARTFGTSRAVGTALWGYAAATPAADRLAVLEEATEVLSGPDTPLERALVLVDIGMTLRRAKRRADARPVLREGLDLAERLGARTLADRAEAELRASGAKPRRRVLVGVDALTPSERRVAEMAADGLTNRQIGQQLFVSMRTVENHLSGVFRKLGIASRAEIGDVLQRGEEAELAVK
jgi:DNA-binding CsgD family transcriptional regulator